MRIIRGYWKSKRINPPQNLPVRPTTDMAKEALFNVLENRFDITTLRVLDLFSGTGNISYECASRGVQQVTCIEQNFRCVEFIKKTVDALQMKQVRIWRADVFQFLKKTNDAFDFIFADPPYDCATLNTLPDLIFSNHLLAADGIFVLEHPAAYSFVSHPNFQELRNYGKVNFTFFTQKTALPS